MTAMTLASLLPWDLSGSGNEDSLTAALASVQQTGSSHGIGNRNCKLLGER